MITAAKIATDAFDVIKLHCHYSDCWLGDDYFCYYENRLCFGGSSSLLDCCYCNAACFGHCYSVTYSSDYWP